MQIPDQIGGIKIFRAARKYEDLVYESVKSAVFKKFPPGRYADKEDIRSIINYKYELYYDILNENINKFKSKELVTLLIREYEKYGKVSDAYEAGKLTANEDSFWRSYALASRRGIKHVLELLFCTDLKNIENITYEQYEKAISLIFIAAEELVNLYMHSHYYAYFTEDIVVILDPNEYTYFDTEKLHKIDFDVRKYVQGSEDFIPQPDFLHDLPSQGRLLDVAFKENLGVTYQDTIGTIEWLIEEYSSRTAPELVGSFYLQEAIDVLTNAYKISRKQAQSLIDGFSLDAKFMAKEKRELFRPKQEYRAYRRAFFQYFESGKVRVIFSRRMAKESVRILLSDVSFKKIPTEWRTESIKKALDATSLAAGKFFENAVKKIFQEIQILGTTSFKKHTFKDGTRITVPLDVGDIDFLGYCQRQNMIFIIEAKQVGPATEPRMYQDDEDKFIRSDKNYKDKFVRKYNWAIENIDLIEKYVREKYNNSFSAQFVGFAMVVRYPLFIAYRIKEFPCVTIPELIALYKDAGNNWPFNKKEISRISK